MHMIDVVVLTGPNQSFKSEIDSDNQIFYFINSFDKYNLLTTNINELRTRAKYPLTHQFVKGKKETNYSSKC